MEGELSPKQREIVESDNESILVIAGPGTGKTKVVTERIKFVLTKLKGNFHVLALTFTNKAADEMKERMMDVSNLEKRVFVGTIHSFCYKVLRDRGKPIGIDGDIHILNSLEDKKSVLLEALDFDLDITNSLKEMNNDKDREKLLSHWINIISQFKRQLILPESVTDERDRRIYQAYDAALKSSNLMDFDDLLIKTYELFIRSPGTADLYRRQYRYICVDESQDLNYAQYEIIKLLCQSNIRNVVMVGDPNQSIFGFIGSSPKYMEQFKEDFYARTITLEENFRSARAIIEAAHKLMPEFQVSERLPIEGMVSLIVGQDEEREADLVLERLLKLAEKEYRPMKGVIDWEKFALIGRNRYVLNQIETKLKSKGIPYYKLELDQQLDESELIKEFELALEILSNPQDMLHLGELLTRWKSMINPRELVGKDIDRRNMIKKMRMLGGTNGEIISNALNKIDDFDSNFSLKDSLEYLTGYVETSLEKYDRELVLKDIKEWHNRWTSYLRNSNHNQRSLGSYLNYVLEENAQSSRKNGIALLTIHSAKGLEFDLVALMGMVEGVFPDYRAKGDQMVEERRNAFVSLTRSKRLLLLSYPRTRQMPWGETIISKPSRFLKEIGLLEE